MLDFLQLVSIDQRLTSAWGKGIFEEVGISDIRADADIGGGKKSTLKLSEAKSRSKMKQGSIYSVTTHHANQINFKTFVSSFFRFSFYLSPFIQKIFDSQITLFTIILNLSLL